MSPLYPALELAALGVAGAAVAAGSARDLWPTCVFGWTLLALGVIDWREYRLPDLLTLPLLAAGLLLALFGDPADAWSSLLGALAGGGAVVVIRAVYAALRGREGIGLGDAKLLAALGAWLGWEALPAVVLVAAWRRWSSSASAPPPGIGSRPTASPSAPSSVSPRGSSASTVRRASSDAAGHESERRDARAHPAPPSGGDLRWPRRAKRE